MPIRVDNIAYHRNGSSGAPFYVVTFIDPELRTPTGPAPYPPMIAIVFDEPFHVAVFDQSLLGEGVIEFGRNSWRGDRYEPELRKAIQRFDQRLESRAARQVRAAQQPTKAKRRRSS